MILPEKTYDFFKRLIQVIIPALGALYFGLAQIWELPNPEGVVATLALLCTFMGVVLGISSQVYYRSAEVFDGAVVMAPGEDGELEAHAGLVTPAADIANKTHIVLRVSKPEQ